MLRKTKDVELDLAQPLDKSKVRTRAGKGGSGDLSYLPAHEVKREMNAVFGRLAWDMRTLEQEALHAHTYKGKYGDMLEVVAYAKVEVTVRFHDGPPVVSTGVGVGNGTAKADGSAMDAYELALKEAESDAFKRACVRFGDRFGLVLYDKEAPRVNATGKKAPDLSAVASLADLDEAWKALDPAEKKAFQEVFSLRKRELSQ